MIYYLPLEPYEERYTAQLSGPNGWMETALKKAQAKFIRIEGDKVTNKINTGRVLDARGRCIWAMSQIRNLIESYDLTSKDIIYVEDFFHPGIESLAYIIKQEKSMCDGPQIATFCWAQTFDKYDFTRYMPFMFGYEDMCKEIYNTIFVASALLRDLILTRWKFSCDPFGFVKVVGLPFDQRDVQKYWYPDKKPVTLRNREKIVVFSSRFDNEKNPFFFAKVAKRVKEFDSEFRFIALTSGNGSITSEYVECFNELTKKEYYDHLRLARFQFNCADQDWVSFTLLEALAYGCIPIYPNFRSFPEVFGNHMEYLYKNKDVESAAESILFMNEELEKDPEGFYGPHNDMRHTILAQNRAQDFIAKFLKEKGN